MKKRPFHSGKSAFGMRRLFTAIALSMGCASLHAEEPSNVPSPLFPHPERIRYDHNCLTLEGRDFFLSSAAFHYFRTPPELWRDRFQKIKDAGFNTVETYIPWNWHERDLPSGLDDFSKIDLSEFEAWLKMAQDEFGFYTIVRPGPFICAEWGGGGYPRWLAKFNPWTGKEFWLRSADDAHLAWSVHWYEAVCKVFAREQITRKPKGAKGIILVQIENEYDYHKAPGKPKVLRTLFDAVKKAGIEVPVFTCRTEETRGSKDPVLSQVFDCDNLYVPLNGAPGCAERMVSLRSVQPNAPAFVTELQGGWFSLVGDRLSEENYSDARHFNAIHWMSLLGGATGLNDYMFVGGTHFGGWGARGQTTTYDYNAAIREWGSVSPKYFVAKGVNEFLREHAAHLARAEGGPCELQGAPASLFGGVRVAPDGTRFVFLHNTDAKNPVSGKATVVPGKIAQSSGPIYNYDQEGNRVLVKTADGDSGAAPLPSFEVEYALADLGAKVLVIPPGKTPAEGTWYPKAQEAPAPKPMPAPVRIASALKRLDPLDGQWRALTDGKSLPELGVSDQRYALYRSRFTLSEADAAKLGRLLVNSFSRDIVTAQVNGRLAGRLYPDEAYAAAATRNKKLSFDRIRPDEFDNRFDLGGLLRAGENEIVLVYENIGHEHGYIPMEELSGIRRAGLSTDETAIAKPLDWQVASDLGGITAGWTRPGFSPQGWEKVALDTERTLERKGNGIQPKDTRDGLVTWYRLEFELPESPAGASSIPWRLLLDASGNGFMWLNGHDIGRHWEIGPQREFYLPECWLNQGAGRKNVLVLGLRQTVNGAKLRAAEVSPYPQP
ncbi:MAG TPA: beta-galactosidase [Luteolibacter sp.]